MFEDRLSELQRRGLLRTLRHRTSPQGRSIQLDGRTLINFSSNDYLGLANHPLLKESAIRAIEEYGTGSGASRLLGGGSILHRVLEERIALFKGGPSGLVLNSGYTANLACIAALTVTSPPKLSGEVTVGDYIFSDELNHASIIDGIRLSRAKVFIYRHKDMAQLEEFLHSVKDQEGKKIIVTDSVFSMDGDIAPLDKLVELSDRYGAILYIDDAHATGVLGGGRGSLAHFGLGHKDSIVQMGTFSKALGSFGAYVVCEESIKRWFINSARGFIYSTALPPSVIAASIKAIEIIESDRSLIEKLWSNRERVMAIFRNYGLELGPTETPIIPVLFSSVDRCLRFSEALFERGIYAPAIRPPTVKIPRIRFTVTAAHTEEDIEQLEEAIKDLVAR